MSHLSLLLPVYIISPVSLHLPVLFSLTHTQAYLPSPYGMDFGKGEHTLPAFYVYLLHTHTLTHTQNILLPLPPSLLHTPLEHTSILFLLHTPHTLPHPSLPTPTVFDMGGRNTPSSLFFPFCRWMNVLHMTFGGGTGRKRFLPACLKL